MIHPASDKVLALSVIAGEPLEQGTVLRFIDHDGNRMKALAATATADFTDFGTFLAYWISPDSEDVEFTGAPQSTTFDLNTDTGVGGGTQTIASGEAMVALGGSKIALVRIDANSLEPTPSDLTGHEPGLILEVDTTSGFLSLTGDADLNENAAKVVQNDVQSIVVLLA